MDTSLEKIGLLIARYEGHLKSQGFRPKTVWMYRINVRKFTEYLKEEERLKDLKEVDRKTITRYQTYLYGPERKLSLSTQQSKLIALRSFFRFLEKENLVFQDPTSGIEYPKQPERLPRNIFSEKEMKQLLQAVDIEVPLGLRNRAILEVLYATGMRSSELAGLDVYDIDFEKMIVRIREGKGGKDRVVPLGQTAATYVREYLEQERKHQLIPEGERALFLSAQARRIDYRRLPQIVKIYAKRSGITRYVCAHMIRHSMATHMLRRGAPIRYIQEMLGHRNLNTTQIYTRVEVSDLAKVYRKTHPRA